MIRKQKFQIALLVSSILVILLPYMKSITLAESTPSDPNLPAQVQSVLPQDLQWESNPTLAGVQSAIALGDPTTSELYVMFGKMEAGAEFPAHTHPDDRITTVISGVMYYGTGEQSDRANIQTYPAGSVVYTPAGTPHYMLAKDEETVMQETGRGPTGLEFTAGIK